MDRTEIEKKLNSILKYANMVHKDDVYCVDVELLQSIMDLILKQEAEIEYWKEKNRRDSENFFKSSESLRNAYAILNRLNDELLNGEGQTKIEVLSKLKENAVEIYSKEFGQMEFVGVDVIDEFIKEIENEN